MVTAKPGSGQGTRRKIVGITATDLKDVLAYGLLLVVIYVALWLAIGSGFNYGEPCWCVMVLWVAAHVGGLLFSMVHLPPLLGMLLSGMLIRNAMPFLIEGLPSAWKAQIRAMALGTIFLRSGLELDLQVFKRVGPACIRLLLIPGLVEAFVTGSAAAGIFQMPIFLGFTLGFILKAVGPAIVIQTMFEVQQARLGTKKGIPSIVVGAASFDDMVAITGYSLFSSLALNTNKPLWETILHGPIDLALGTVAGCIGAVFCSMTKIWDTALKRLLAVFFTTMVLLFTLYHFHYNGGGALSALVLGMVLSICWERGIHFFGVPGWITIDGPGSEGNKDFTVEVEHTIGVFWRFVAQPLLFGIIGTMINFKTLDTDTIPKSLAIVFIGMAVRMPTTFTSMMGAGLTWKERLFIVFAWTPKATVQAALGAQPLDIIKKSSQWPDHTDPEYLKYEEHGEQILTTAVFAVLVCAPVGVMLIHFVARRFLHEEEDSDLGKDSEATLKAVQVSSFSMRNANSMSRAPSLLSVRDAVTSYIHGTESGWPLENEHSAASRSQHHLSHAHSGSLSVAAKDSTTGATAQDASVGAMRSKSTTSGVKTEANKPSTPKGGSGKPHANGKGPVAEGMELEMTEVALSAEPTSASAHASAATQQSVIEQYLASIEVLAEALDTPHITAPAPEHSAQLRQTVQALRQQLAEGHAGGHLEVAADQQAVVSARRFFHMTQAAQTLPDIDAALEKLQLEVLAK